MSNLLIYISIIIFILVIIKYNNNENMTEEHIYEFFNNDIINKPFSSVGIITFMRKPIDLSLWFKHHRQLGITQFFIRVEDTPELEDYLKDIYKNDT